MLVERDVGAAEFVDGLFGVADQEELARRRRGRQPVGLIWIGRGQQHQDLRLQRIGILKLIDEQVAEALLKVRPHLRLVFQKIASHEQQVDEIELPGARLQLLVGFHQVLHLGAQQGGQVGSGALFEIFERRQQALTAGQDVLAPRAVGEEAGALFQVPLQIAGELEQQAFHGVEIFSPHAIAALEPHQQLLRRTQRVYQVVVRPPAFRGHRRQFRDLRQQLLDSALAIERLAPPQLRKIAPLDQLPAGLPQLFHGRTALPGVTPGEPGQRAPQPRRGLAELALEPLIESARFLESRIDASFDGPRPQNLSAESVDGADGGFFERLQS